MEGQSRTPRSHVVAQRVPHSARPLDEMSSCQPRTPLPTYSSRLSPTARSPLSGTTTMRPSTEYCSNFEVKQYLERKDLFAPLLQHRAVALSNGKLAVDNINRSILSVSSLGGGVDDPRDFGDPCPTKIQITIQYKIQRIAGQDQIIRY